VRPTLEELLAHAHVISLPLVTRFRGLDVREAMLLRGPNGWTEFSPFDDYSDEESAAWLRAAIEFGWGELPPIVRTSIPVNATVPAVSASDVPGILARFAGARTAKVKVGGPGTTLALDIERVRAVRLELGSEGRIRLDANGTWNVDEAEHAVHALAEFDLEYVEQPCSSISELAQLRERIAYMGIPIAADESVRRESDPLEVARVGAADILVIKVQPLGGIENALRIIHSSGLPAVVSSALDTSVGLAMGAHLAAAMPELEFDCGLGTAALLAADVTDAPLLPVAGHIPVVRPEVNDELLARHAASPERATAWHQRLARVHALL
jgi:O-succinylbenzoate synthase